MIKTGILGGETWVAGELIRILIHHPEVELTAVIAPTLKGRLINSYHSGLVGDTKLSFTDSLDVSSLDALFVVQSADKTFLDSIKSLNPEIRIITLFPENIQEEFESANSSFFRVPAVSELYRKPMVRGATIAGVLNPVATLALIMLYPLAAHLALTDGLKINVTSNFGDDENEKINSFISSAMHMLQKFQLSFPGNATIGHKMSAHARDLEISIEMKTKIPIAEIKRFYEDIYYDHNFTFIVDSEVTSDEVTGTQKSLINISKPDDDTLVIKGVADPLMRGGAGDAVHAMNLMFGLYEKIGLSFKTVTDTHDFNQKQAQCR